MRDAASDKIDFDILIRSPASGDEPALAKIDRFRPKPEDIEGCRRWLSTKGVTCHPTDFGLACSASPELFESLFSTQLKPKESSPGAPSWRCLSDPKPPPEIAHYIEQITISAPPEFF